MSTPTDAAVDRVATPTAAFPPATRLARFYYEPALLIGGKPGPAVAVLVGSKWKPYMVALMGIKSKPFYERLARPQEADAHPNGHPFAWVYQSTEQLCEDEARWLSPAEFNLFRGALETARATYGVHPHDRA